MRDALPASKVSTAELTAFSGKHWGSGLPNYFQSLLAASLRQGLCLPETQHSSMFRVLKVLIDFTFHIAVKSLLSRSLVPPPAPAANPPACGLNFFRREKAPFSCLGVIFPWNLGETERRTNFHGATTSPLKETKEESEGRN